MSMSRTGLAAVALLLVGATDLAAQRASATTEPPGTVAMRYYQCAEGQLDAAAGILAGTWRRIARELIDEGLLLEYRILTRSWGDEWNLIEYYLASDAEAFEYAYEELELRYHVADGASARRQQFETLCPRRKDSHYRVVP